MGQIYLNDALRYAERKLQNHIQQHPQLTDTEGTIALTFFNEDGTVTVAWIGNCRVYHIRSGTILYRTEDHKISHWGKDKRSQQMKPRGIAAGDPTWISVHTITHLLPDDYLLLCTPGVSEVLDDRNIKYLFSQADGSETTNRAIIEKVEQLCATQSQRSYSLLLLPIEQTPFTRIAAPESAYTKPISPAPAFNKPKTGAIELPPREKFKFEMPSVESNFNSRALLRIVAVLGLVVLLAGSVWAYRFFANQPDRVFSDRLTQAQSLIAEGSYEQAVVELEAALKIGVADFAAIGGGSQNLAQSPNRIGGARSRRLAQKG